MTSYVEWSLALYKLYPQVTSIVGETAFTADGNVVSYDKTAVQAEVQANTYKNKRAAEYPSTADQFDLLYHGGYDAWKIAIDAVKTKYPKG